MSFIPPNPTDFETTPLIQPSGFREYDARWLYPEQINPRGFILLGAHLGQMVMERSPRQPAVVVGHDYRAYSAHLKHALVVGLMSAGVQVVDVGLCTTPVTYFAQFHLNIPAMAMVTASHNENGWTGVKMGIGRPLTFGPMDMADLKRRVLESKGVLPSGTMGGTYQYRPDVVAAYVDDLVKDGPVKRPLKVVASCGNGTPGMFAADVLRRLGCTVIEQNCNLDYTFPNHNPNPEEHDMLQAMGTAVQAHGADLALGFDGDGDRCGVVDHQGNGILGDVLGVLLARDLVTTHGAVPVIADIKSTGLYAIDPVLTKAGVRVDYWRTGHAYMKRRLFDAGSGAAFEKSGHYFYGAPVGRGYDDGLFSAVQVLRMLDRNPGRSIADMVVALPTTHLSPSLYRTCPDDKKYALADRFTTMIQDMQAGGQTILGQKITDVLTINGVRFMIEDGTWGLVRASSNKPEIGLVFESPVSQAQMVAMFNFVDALLTENFPEVGAYNEQMKLAA